MKKSDDTPLQQILSWFILFSLPVPTPSTLAVWLTHCLSIFFYKRLWISWFLRLRFCGCSRLQLPVRHEVATQLPGICLNMANCCPPQSVLSNKIKDVDWTRLLKKLNENGIKTNTWLQSGCRPNQSVWSFISKNGTFIPEIYIAPLQETCSIGWKHTKERKVNWL